MSWQVNWQTHLPYLRPDQYKLLTKDLRQDNEKLKDDLEFLGTELEARQAEIDAKQQEITRLTQQTVAQANTINQQTTQIQNQANTIGQQNQQITALQTTVAQLQAQGSFPATMTKITQDTTLNPGTLVVMSFPGGASNSTSLFTFTVDGDTSYRYGNPTQGAVTAIAIYQPNRNLFFITDRDDAPFYVQNCNYLRLDYNGTYNNRILTFT